MATYTYPGVYIEEVKSQVHTITGVATSVAAFVGWANKGPIDQAALIFSFADFDRLFGGLNKDSYLGYAVQHFFANGGSSAYIVRLEAGATPATVRLKDSGAVDVLQIDTKNPGAWGRSISIDTKARATDPTRFRIAVSYTDPNGRITTESYENLSMNPANARFVESVVNNASQLIKATVVTPTTPVKSPPTDQTGTAVNSGTAGEDGTILTVDLPAFKSALTNLTNGTDTRLDLVDLFNLFVVPGETDATTINTLEAYCKTRRALMIVDGAAPDNLGLTTGPTNTIVSPSGDNAAIYFPWLSAPDALNEGRPNLFPPSGFVAGVYSRIDASRGVWKAPAGIEAGLTSVTDVDVKLTDAQNGVLNPLGVNCIRSFPIYGIVVWGARTLAGADEIGSEWKYVPVRRMALFLEESLYRGTQWVVFEPNDEPLWSQIRLNLTAFMMSLFRQGAFQGTKPSDAFFVKCDKETTTQDDINKGIVNILVGFAPLKPAEFVVIKLSQIAGQVV
jgi:phage tail sheath protein FI